MVAFGKLAHRLLKRFTQGAKTPEFLETAMEQQTRTFIDRNHKDFVAT